MMNDDTNNFLNEPLQEQQANMGDVYFDAFRIRSGGVFDNDHVVSVTLPSLQLDFKRVFGVGPVQVLCYNLAPSAANVLNAAKTGLSEFAVQLLNEDEMPESTWTFKNASISAIYFGVLDKQPKSYFRSLECVITFDEIEIDGVSLKINQT